MVIFIVLSQVHFERVRGNHSEEQTPLQWKWQLAVKRSFHVIEPQLALLARILHIYCVLCFAAYLAAS